VNAADLVILALVLASTVVGTIRGFVREAVALVFLLGGLYAAWAFGPAVEPHLGGYLAAPAVRPWIARLCVLVIVLLVGMAVGALLSMLMRSAGLGAVDRLIGMMFGALRGIVLVALLVMCGALVRLNHEPWWNRSKLVPYCEMVGGWLRTMVGDKSGPWGRLERLTGVDGN